MKYGKYGFDFSIKGTKREQEQLRYFEMTMDTLRNISPHALEQFQLKVGYQIDKETMMLYSTGQGAADIRYIYQHSYNVKHQADILYHKHVTAIFEEVFSKNPQHAARNLRRLADEIQTIVENERYAKQKDRLWQVIYYSSIHGMFDE